jgi:hypothetical protein
MTSPLFPNLYQIKWNDFRPETLPFIRQLAGPKVTNLTVGDLTSWGPAELSILGSLRHLCPNVKQVQILPTPKHDTLPTDIVSELLCSWTDLQTVKCRSINGNALLYLATLETLEVLSFTFDRRSFKHSLGTSIVQFPALRRLFITSLALPSLSKMMRQLRMSIEALFIGFGGWPTIQHIQSFAITIQESCAQGDMHFIDLRQLDISDPAVQAPAGTGPLTLGDLFPLTCFSNLVSVNLDTGYIVNLGDDDMLALGTAWPNIRHLSINEQRGWRTSSGLTPQGLVRLLQQCKFLRKLCIVIDTSDFSAIPLDHQITDVDVDFRESIYTRDVGPRLLKPVDDLDPLVDVVSPLTPALGLRISTRARPNAQGTMALYLAEGGGSDRLLGLSCRHVLIGSQEGNFDYSYHPGAPAKDVLLLGKRAYADVVDSIKLAIGGHGISAKRWRKQIEGFKEREKGNDAADVAKAEASRIKTEGLLDEAEKAMEELGGLLNQVNKEWKKIDNRVIGHILRSPPIGLGVSEQHFTEDWGVFVVDRTKLGDGFQGNKMDLGAF